MAIEHVSITAGTGTDIATDVVGTDNFQVVKIALGADGAMDNLVDSGQQTAASSIPVVLASDGTIVPGTGATNLGKAEDSGHTSGDVGVAILSVRNDVVEALAADNDYSVVQTDANGRLYVNTEGPTPWSAFHNIAGGAHTDVELQAAPGAGSLHITDLIITNDATLATTVFLEEATAGAKTAKTPTMYIPASGGISIRFATPIKLTATTNLGFTTTGTANTSIQVNGYTAV